MNAAILHTLETASGKITGLSSDGIVRFCGIPFAKPPVGPLRWRMPEPAEPWAGVLETTRFAPISPQAPSQIETLMGRTIGEQSEDCLYLNVWTPACDNAKRPVMVWIHGGAFVIGAGSQGIYNGRALASRNVVIVTINYRLGAFGFVNLHDATDGILPARGTEGLADQILALHWVRQNIGAFGGDPDNVTIFGESAGAMSVSALLATPHATGLFAKAIAQSGAAHIGHDRERAVRVGHALLANLGLSRDTAERALAFSHGDITRAQIALLADVRQNKDSRKLGALAFQPAIDGEILPERPIDAIARGSARNIPLLTGTTRDEWKMFTAANPMLRLMSNKTFASRIEHMAGPAAAEMLAAYSKGSVFERFNAMMTDKVFTIPAIRMLEAQGAHAPVFAYRFDWASRLLGGILGSCHAMELGFVFGTHGEKLVSTFFGKGPAAEALSDAMQESWTNFARTGSPSGRAAENWPLYETSNRATMMFGDGLPHVAHAPNENRRRAWLNVPEKRLGP